LLGCRSSGPVLVQGGSTTDSTCRTVEIAVTATDAFMAYLPGVRVDVRLVPAAGVASEHSRTLGATDQNGLLLASPCYTDRELEGVSGVELLLSKPGYTPARESQAISVSSTAKVSAAAVALVVHLATE